MKRFWAANRLNHKSKSSAFSNCRGNALASDRAISAEILSIAAQLYTNEKFLSKLITINYYMNFISP